MQQAKWIHLVLGLAATSQVWPKLATASPFVNLDFEQATVPSGTGSISLDAAMAFPGWTARINDTPLSTVYYDYDGIGEPALALYDRAATDLGIPLLQGRYDAIVIGGFGGFPQASLSQSGDVPAEAKSIKLFGTGNLFPPTVTIDGALVPIARVSGSGLAFERCEFAGDVSSFAGRTCEIRISNPVPPQGVLSGFDSISFSSEPVPESLFTPLVAVIGLLNIRRNRGR